MWFLRRMRNMSWTDKVSNERVLTIANEKCELMQTIKEGKLKLLVHTMRRNGTDNLALTRKVEGKKWRQRVMYSSNIKEWT